MTNKVWATHQPGRWDSKARKWVPLNLSLVAPFGELFLVIPGTERPPVIADALPLLKTAFADYQPNDYLLMVGHSELLLCAAVLALQKCNGKLQLLKWHDRYGRYELIDVPTALLT